MKILYNLLGKKIILIINKKNHLLNFSLYNKKTF